MQIINFVVKMVEKLSDSDIKSAITECIISLKNEIADFNKDLQQISQELSYGFVSDLHDLCLHLLWKWYEEKNWEDRVAVFDQMENQRDNQYQIFMGYLDTDIRKNSDSNALIFVQKYTEFMLEGNEKEKQRYTQEKKTAFLHKYTREKVQDLVDGRMATCDD